MYRVYRIQNQINSKVYIGITSRDVSERFREHLSRARCSQRDNRLYQAFRKYGKENFTVEEIASTHSEDEVRMLESKYILENDSYSNGYNCNLGGNGHLHIPQDVREKMSNAQKGKVITAETKRNMSLAKLGDKRCAEHFGAYTGKGAESPLAKQYLIQFPDGHTEIVSGIRQFCRDNDLSNCKLIAKGRTKGFVILRRLNDYPEREYTQVGGSARRPSNEGRRYSLVP